MREGQMNEVRFQELHENDTLVVQTHNNVYRFKLANVDQRVGTLEGGEFTDPSFVVASGTLSDKEIKGDAFIVGGRAVFIASAPPDTQGFRRIITSEIESIRVDHTDHSDLTGRRAA